MTVITEPKEWFETRVHELIEEDPSRVGDFDGTLAFEITGETGGKWLLRIKDGKAEASEGEDAEVGFKVKMKDVNFVKMMNGELSGPVAFMCGRLKFKGDLKQAIKLRGLLLG